MCKTSTGLLALTALGIFYAWRNRFQIQRFLERQGIDTNIDTSNLVNSVKSAAAKITGKTEGELDQEARTVRSA